MTLPLWTPQRCRRRIAVTSVLFTILAAALAAEQPAKTTPQSRFFYNDDGDRAVFLLKGPFHERQLNYPVDVLVGTGVTTLVYCANFGSDQAYYPSKVASPLGWRETESIHKNDRFTYFNRVHEIGALLRQRQIDILGTVMRRARQQGLEFVPSLRMNDTHFLNKVPPTEHPSTGEFWMRNRDLTVNGRQLDFSHKKVRDYRLGQIKELIDGYATDGFEMDFSRQPSVFPESTGHEKHNLITNMVRQTRHWLDQKSEKDGRNRFLIVRVAHNLDLCQFYGFNVGGWMADNLVDYIVPASPDRYFQFDIPIAQFVALARRTNSTCRVIAGTDSYKATPGMYRAAMTNYYAQGQQDTYLFNFFAARSEQRNYYPFRDEDYALLRDLKSPVTLWGRPKHFLSYGWFPGRTVQVQETGKPYDITLYIGEDLATCRRENILKQALLQIEVKGRHVGDELTFALNGQSLLEQQSDSQPELVRFDLKKTPPVVGPNRISVTAERFATESRPSVARVELLTDYDITGVTSASQ